MSDILIIGGGILGMLTARELCMAGADVHLLEQGQVGKESSWAGGGIVSPLYPWRYPDSVSHLASWGQTRYPEFCQTLMQQTSTDPEYIKSGLMIVAADEIQNALAWGNRFTQKVELIDRKQIATLEPELAQLPEQALWLPEVGQVRNPRFAKALQTDIEQKGVKISTQTKVQSLSFANGKVQAAHANTGVFQANKIIVCTGAWTGDFLHNTTAPPQIHPVKGQMLLFKGKPNTIQHMMLQENRYIIPRADGRILFGSTIEETGYDKSTTLTAKQELEEIATQRFPILKQFPIEKHWAGLRPGSPSGIPYIAQHSEIENLYINAGHFRNGVVLGLASAHLMADLILQRAAIVDPAPYALVANRSAII